MGLLRRSQNRLSEAKLELETAIALDRNNALAIAQLGQTLIWMGQPEAGIARIEKAIRLDPHNPGMPTRYWELGACHLLLEHVDEAIDLFRKGRAGGPGLYFIHYWLAGAPGLKSDLEEARAELAASLKLQPEINSVAQWRHAVPWATNPQYLALEEKTLDIGLRRAGFADE
jgi:tetratricopeptide (TPR) repeat protein